MNLREVRTKGSALSSGHLQLGWVGWSAEEGWNAGGQAGRLCHKFINYQVAYRYFNTGRQLIKPVMRCIFRGMGLSENMRCHIRHFTLFTPEWALACMELNTEQQEAKMLQHSGNNFWKLHKL